MTFLTPKACAKTLLACSLSALVVACTGEGADADGGSDADKSDADADDGDADSALGSGGTTDGPGSGGTSSGGTENGTGGGENGSGGSTSTAACDNAGLVWKTARKTTYTSYPDPDSEECVEYNGCMWAGWFAACQEKQTEAWVEEHNIAAVFPGFDNLAHHEICIRSGDKEMIVYVVDTCGDSDCDGCCTENQADNDALVDLESFTNARWGLGDGVIEWADLGPASQQICD